MNFSTTSYEWQLMKARFRLWMLKPKDSKSSGRTYIHQRSRKSLNKRLPTRRMMTTVFCDRKGWPIVEFMQQGTTTKSWAIRNKRSGMLTYGIVLLHDNARPHTAACTSSLLEHLNWELFDHPPYSPDLAPSDWHLFICLKNWLGSQRSTILDPVTDGGEWSASRPGH
jgi:hypothetical protein